MQAAATIATTGFVTSIDVLLTSTREQAAYL
jgi:hypothetical protein